MSWVPFEEFKKSLRKQFDSESGWDKRKNFKGIADLCKYQSEFIQWLVIQLAKPQRVFGIPGEEMEEISNEEEIIC